jgi:hypothetical protein
MIHPVYQQRIAVAVAASQKQAVTLRVDGDGDTAYVVWMDRNRHVIASGSEKGMKALLPDVQAEFKRQMDAQKVEGRGMKAWQ